MKAPQTLVTVVVAQALLVGTSLSAHGAQQTTDVRAAIASAYAKIDSAIESNNPDAAAAYCTPNFKDVVNARQTIELSAYKSNLKSMLVTASQIKSSTEIGAFSVKGTMASVTVTQTASYTTTNPVISENVRVVVLETDKDIWVRTSSGWRQRMSTTLDNKTFVVDRAVALQPMIDSK